MNGATTITIRVPLTIRSRPGRKMLVTPGAAIATRADPALVKALARAFRWKRMLDDGKRASITEIATEEKLDRSYVGAVLRLTLLAPDIVQAIMHGRAPADLTLPRMLEPWPVEWEGQRTSLYGAASVRCSKVSALSSTPERVTGADRPAPQPGQQPAHPLL